MRLLLFQHCHTLHRRGIANASYHRNKHKRGRKDRTRKTPEQKRQSQREAERRCYRKQRAALGKVVKNKRAPGATSPEELHAEMLRNSRNYRLRNPKKRRESTLAWSRRNRLRTQARFVERYHSDPQFNLAIKFRRRVWMALKKCKIQKQGHHKIIKLLGCTFSDFKKHIESQFTDGMTWEGVISGKIHLDHKQAVSTFDLTDPEQVARCFSWQNMQPLWAFDNLSKGAKLIYIKKNTQPTLCQS